MRTLLFLLFSASLSQAWPERSLPDPAWQGGEDFLSTARERTAYTYVLAGTFIPIAAGLGLALSSENQALTATGGVLILGGILVGPSAGEFYAGAYGRGALAVSLRTLGGAILLIGAAAGLESCIDTNPCPDRTGAPAVALGTIILLGATVFSVIDTHFAALSREGDTARVDFAPTLALGGGLRPGLTAWTRF